MYSPTVGVAALLGSSILRYPQERAGWPVHIEYLTLTTAEARRQILASLMLAVESLSGVGPR